MTEDEFLKKYAALGHAIQTGVAWDQQLDRDKKVEYDHAKHLRTGLNLVMCDHASLGRLLIKKGIISEEEYFDALLEGLEDEKAKYEAMLNERLGGNTKISLG